MVTFYHVAYQGIKGYPSIGARKGAKGATHAFQFIPIYHSSFKIFGQSARRAASHTICITTLQANNRPVELFFQISDHLYPGMADISRFSLHFCTCCFAISTPIAFLRVNNQGFVSITHGHISFTSRKPFILLNSNNFFQRSSN